MWTVIRQRQGLSPNERPTRQDTPYSAHQRCIQLHEVRPDVPYMCPTDFSKAYGDFVYLKIRRWLLDERVDVRQQAADHLVELYTEKREHCVHSLAFDLLPILLSTLEKDESAALRERAAAALELLVRETQAQRLLLQRESVTGASGGAGDATAASAATLPLPPHLASLLAALHDDSDEVVVAALRVVVACHAWQNSFAVTEALVQGGLVPVLIRLMLSPSASVQVFACSATRLVFQVKEAHVQFLKCGGVATLTKAIAGTEAVALVAEAAEAVSLIAEYPQGRRDAVSSGTLASLLPHLHNTNLTLRVAVYSAAAQVTVLEAAKMQATELGYPEQLSSEIAGEDERDVLMHMLRLIHSLAEWPAARVTLRACLPRIAALRHIADGDDGVLLALSQAERILSKKVFPV
ncbi:hypothetical protein NESM_000856400 [Novymonas esmeraldas]|uniref:Uncharacterized protein n=1 Tax=Novymonas esmeraldas TaxID=1808958 RepID=A0AAW0EY30_9TRYP